ncbi:hypothetical protein AU184_15360 [Mycolicibacterium novocastrense]|uniref:FkbM family methyltransferase n=1 Tax=Mycolicibacterium novocastrense TaxID=59813 RepID=UPI00074B0B24|nr:FkbM family methyltransferase [Mycolicibacterium novocastrense]KUH75767.1 hypothetical protein AU183_00380 [Mycolicibacterium novocastrense]KUH78328.1 hypothetical protein AU072_10440 [Mycolicibacterium novocastrense]KUH79663.1 hypothetical protein AU184_15360 [Mycolicibacterium novocastrense]
MMIERRIAAVWRWYIRLFRTDKERVGLLERVVRAAFMIGPYGVGILPLYARAGFWKPLVVDGTSLEGIRLRCRVPDIIQLYIYLFGTWEPDLVAFMRSRLTRGDTFIDIGANVGYMSALAGKLVGADGGVVALEPATETIAALNETLAMNNLANVRVVAAAVSDHHGELPLFAGPSFGTGLTSTVAHSFLREAERVSAAPLNSLVTAEELASARLIKIDVEGAEDRVLAGILPTVDSLRDDAEIMVELTPKWWTDPNLRPIDVLRPFLDLGFHVYLLPYDYWPWRYLWPNDVGAPKRLRDLTVLESREGKVYEIILSRQDVEAL